jgi:leucyl-tRNA synthetase
MSRVSTGGFPSYENFKKILQLLAPFAPHITEELWHELGEKESIHLSQWPTYDPQKVLDETVTIGVQINGKTRAELSIRTDASKEEMERAALALPRIVELLAGKSPKTVIAVPRRIINIVV